MSRDYEIELENRVAFIKRVLAESGASGIVYGNSGGKDSALVGILCKKACEDTLGLIMPCATMRNYVEDMEDALTVAKEYGIKTEVADLTPLKKLFVETLGERFSLQEVALHNLAPRLRMTTLYAVASSQNRLVAGTGNRSEGYVGYFTKWGDGAYDFNPIADLTVTEVYQFLDFLGAPECIMKKAPSAGLFDGQTDEGEMGLTYKELDSFLLGGTVRSEVLEAIERLHKRSEHKRRPPLVYGG